MGRSWPLQCFLIISLAGAVAVSPLAAEESPGKRPAEEGRPGAGEPPNEQIARFKAYVLWKNGYLLHVIGEYDQAAAHFRESIKTNPTAEAHTFLGWSLSKLGRIKEAISECKKAIPLDPDFGNPYNDIGVYLIRLGRMDEAIPWLKKAMRAKRYCCYQFPHFNLGRVLLEKGRAAEAERLFKRALEYDPNYGPALKALEFIRQMEMTTL
ncbi:MAG: tetratricopeptide repeat protein [bacterium]